MEGRRSARVILVRHGETDWNAEGRIQGHLPVPLNSRGLAQAVAVAERLAAIPVNALYSSDLPRARQTAEAVARRSGLSVHDDPRLREWDLGVLAGLLRSDAEVQQPEAFRILRHRIADAPIPGGESIRARSLRVTAAVQEIAGRHVGESVVVVTHGGPLGDCYRRAVDAAPDSSMQVALFNAGINVIQVDGENWSIESWGGVDHLTDIGTLANCEARPVH